jgi:hypothetical protein
VVVTGAPSKTSLNSTYPDGMKDKAKQTGKSKAMTSKFMMWVDEEFMAAVNELRRSYDDPPTKSETIRRAVFAQLEATRKSKGKR